MRLFASFGLFLTFLAGLPLTAAPPALTPAVPPPPTLAQSLAAATPHDGLLLAVGAERVPLPAGAEVPPAGTTLEDIAAAFGCRADTFGVMTVVAPATKVALNENPAPPDVSADLNSSTAFKMLAASLDNT